MTGRDIAYSSQPSALHYMAQAFRPSPGWNAARGVPDNGIHQWDAYARRLGFDAAFAHSQRLVAQALAHLPPLNSEAQGLDLWIEGPVAYGSQATLRQGLGGADGEIAF